MKIHTLIFILFISLTQATQIFAKEKTEITFYGKIDPRLYVSARTLYRSMDPKDLKEEQLKKCTQYSVTNKQTRRSLDYDIQYIKIEKDGSYELTIPIDYYKEENPCGYEYVSTKLQIKRDKEDDSYVDFYVLSDDNRVSNRMGKISDSGWKVLNGLETNKKYLQISSGSKIECYTKHYILKDRKTKLFEKRTSFFCEPIAKDDENGVDELKTTSIKLDILVNKNKSTILDESPPYTEETSQIKPYHFIDYKKPPTFLEKVKLYIKNLIKE